MTEIYRTVYGSRLYGTNVQGSDLDIMRVLRPDIDALILQKEKKKGTHTLSGEDDNTSHDVAFVIDGIVKGNATIIDLLFSTQTVRRIELHSDWKHIWDIRDALMPPMSQSMLGYCKSQAQMYFDRGDRIEATEAAITVLKNNKKIGDAFPELEFYTQKYPKFVKFSTKGEPGGVNVVYVHFGVTSFPEGCMAKDAIAVLEKKLLEYGKRTKAAVENKNIDWKGLYHAVRIAEQGIEFHRSRFVTFPRRNAEQLIMIRKGEIPIEEVKSIIQDRVDTLEELCYHLKDAPVKDTTSLVDHTLLEMYKANRQK